MSSWKHFYLSFEVAARQQTTFAAFCTKVGGEWRDVGGPSGLQGPSDFFLGKLRQTSHPFPSFPFLPLRKRSRHRFLFFPLCHSTLNVCCSVSTAVKLPPTLTTTRLSDRANSPCLSPLRSHHKSQPLRKSEAARVCVCVCCQFSESHRPI